MHRIARIAIAALASVGMLASVAAVSYTHLDVYKRQSEYAVICNR